MASAIAIDNNLVTHKQTCYGLREKCNVTEGGHQLVLSDLKTSPYVGSITRASGNETIIATNLKAQNCGCSGDCSTTYAVVPQCDGKTCPCNDGSVCPTIGSITPVATYPNQNQQSWDGYNHPVVSCQYTFNAANGLFKNDNDVKAYRTAFGADANFDNLMTKYCSTNGRSTECVDWCLSKGRDPAQCGSSVNPFGKKLTPLQIGLIAGGIAIAVIIALSVGLAIGLKKKST